MAKDPAPVALTGGAGFHFEDHIAARLLLDMLAATNCLGVTFGRIYRLDWQAREAGWHLDDLAVTCIAGGNERTAGFSCKRDRQVTSSGFPSNFKEAAWEHWHGVAGARRLRENQDAVVLVTGELAEGVRCTWDELLAQALETDPTRMVERLKPPTSDVGSQSSAMARDLFASLHCPSALQVHGSSDELATIRLLRHVRLLHFDYSSPTSRARGLAVADCQRILRSGDSSDALRLWDELIGFAASQRATGGTVDLPKLLTHFGGRYELAPDLQYSAEWISHKFDGAQTLSEWESLDPQGFGVRWVDFAGRSQVIETVRAHLRGRSQPNVLHLAGLSGVGKTRTVLEACRNERDLKEIVYFARFADPAESFLRFLTRNEQVLALVVLDEVPLEDLRSITSHVGQYSHRIRIVTIGPAKRDERSHHSSNILILQKPDMHEGVLAVVRHAGAGLSDPVLESIARFAAHDLRLALMLVQATKQDGEFRDLPIQDGDGVWQRVSKLFRNQIGDLNTFQTHYSCLTAVVDVGIQGEFRHELEYIAKQFGAETAHLDKAIGCAVPCGLGIKTTSFFEPAPRALAGHVFRQQVWGSLHHRVSDFLKEMPDRLLRRFVERCHECVGPEREEMEEALASFFWQTMGSPAVAQLVDRARSRVFKAWAELDPFRGLEWLTSAVEQATDTQLKVFDGDPDGSGGWRGRRQIVWLCESLASFAEFFWNCESVLYRLAQVETEPSIGNNSTVIWKGLFLPILAFTNVPFPARAEHLLKRLSNADTATLPLVLSAVGAALDIPTTSSSFAPPDIVAGRIVPDPWRPKSRGELFELQRAFGKQTLGEIAKLPVPLVKIGQEAVIASLRNFVRLGLLDETRQLLSGVNEELQRGIRRHLTDVIEVRMRAQANAKTSPDSVVVGLRQWIADLEPADLASRVRDLTSMDYWRAMKQIGNPSDRQELSVYAQLAEEVLSRPEVLWELIDWLGSDKAKSAFRFGHALGQSSRGDEIQEPIAALLDHGRCAGLVSGYLRGAGTRRGQLPTEWQSRLDQVAAARPEYSAFVTFDADISEAGFRRVFQLLASDKLPIRYTRGFTFSNWDGTIGNAGKADILRLLNCLESNQEEALAVALELGACWTDYGKKAMSPDLAEDVIQILRKSLGIRGDGGAWSALLESLVPTLPAEVADLVADAITSPGPMRVVLEGLTSKVLVDLAKQQPRLVMEAVGKRLIDSSRRPYFGFHRFEGLFEGIGLSEVQRWFANNGNEAVPYLAFQLETPYLHDNKPTIPPVTDWVMGKFGSEERVFKNFCSGRHSFEVQVGHARDRRSDIEREVEPFRKHELAWVRRWAEWELSENERDATIDDYLDDRQERV